MLTAATIISRALQIAKAPNYTTEALDLLNAILSDLCLHYDNALTRRLFTFDFNPSLTSNFGSGPYSLPVDYLRASGSSGEAQKTFFWTLNGVPYPMIPCDLSEFDMQVQQAGIQSYPWLWATDMANASAGNSARYNAATTAALTLNSTTATLASATGVSNGMGIAGEGIVPGTTLTGLSGTTATLSAGAAATNASASVFFGTPPVGYAYPPPSGAYPVSIRYQALFPPLVDTSKYPWFPDDGYLIEELAGRVMEITDDSRAIEFIGDRQQSGRAGRRLEMYLNQADDKKNRPQIVELDRRRFGSSFRTLRNTKTIGW
jgi:hypothetical protein